MKLITLELFNWLRHQKTVLNFDRSLNVVQGVNEAGKTSIYDAIDSLITGSCRNMKNNRDRKAEQEYIKIGEKSTVIGGFFQDGDQLLIIRKKISSSKTELKKYLNGDDATGKPIDQQEVYNIFSSDERKLKALFSGTSFIDLDEKKRKAFLFDLIGVKVTEDLVKQKLAEKKIDGIIVDVAAKKVMKDGFADAQKWAVMQRRQFKRDLENINVSSPKNEEISYRGNKIKLSQLNISNLGNDIIMLKNEKDQLLQEKGRLSQVIISNDIEKLKGKRIELQAQLKKSFETLEKALTVEELKEKTKSVSEKINSVDEQLKRLNSERIEKESNVNQLSKELKNYEKIQDGVCPVCKSEIGAEVVSKIKKATKAKITRAETSIAVLKKEIRKATDERENHSHSYKSLMEAITGRNELQETTEKTQIELDEIKAKIDESSEAFETAKKDLEAIGVKIEKTDQAINYLESIRSKRNQYLADLKKHDEAVNELDKISKDVDLYDKLEKLLSPQGIINDIIDKAVIPFQEQLDKANEAELMPPIKLDRETFQLKIGEKTENMISRTGSEWKRIGIILSQVIARLAGLKFWIADATELLDSFNRVKLFNFLREIQGQFDTIILISTKDTPPLLDPTYSDINFIWIEDGAARKLTPNMGDDNDAGDSK